MLQKTDASATFRGSLLLLRKASLAGFALLTLASAASADEGRVRGDTGAPTMIPHSDTVSAAPQARKWKGAESASQVRQTSGRQVSDPSETPAELLFYNHEDVAARPVTAAPQGHEQDANSPFQRPTPPQIAAQARNQISTDRSRNYGRVEKSDSGFSSRMNYVLSGGIVTSSAESVGDWWEERSGRMLSGAAPGSGRKRQPAMQRIASAADSMMERATLPDTVEPELDSYEAGPIAVSAPILQTAGFDENGPSPGPQSRLKTDIRTIKPTLSYALKNIDKEQLPEDFNSTLDAGEYTTRQSSPIVYQWAPTNFYHYPLYFEDPSLERYGHTYHPALQPFASTGLFATQLIGLPYQMTLNPIHSKQYSLGYYRPGEYAPKKHYQIPFNEEATIIEVATMAGLFLIIP